LFCNIINIFSLSSDQLNVSLLKYPADPKLWGALKREFSQKIIIPWFTHPQAILGVYDYFFQTHTISYIKMPLLFQAL